MEKEHVNTVVECPECHSPIASTLHSSHCSDEEIVEVIPPERRKRQLRCGHEEVEPSAFPLVSAAHEFKTPLVVMLGYTDLLLNGHLGGVNQRQKQVLGEIQEGAQRLQKLIQDLLLLQELKADWAVVQNQESTSVDESVS
jgi:signal transduction histidine kinase